MRRNLFVAIVFIVAVLLFGKSSVFAAADCVLATGAPLSCNDSSHTIRCPVRRSEGGTGMLYCCATQKDCDNEKTAITSLPTTAPSSTVSTVCQYVSNDAQNPERKSCEDCVINKNGTWTALGCIETDLGAFFSKLLTLSIGIAGGIAFLLILFGGFQILISAGNPEQMNAGREIITSAIAGLLLIIFSVFLLRLVGYDILRIPGFLKPSGL
jgi:hypothetical protein